VIAVDTNVVVSLLTGRFAPGGASRGNQLSTTILALTNLPTVRVEDPGAVSRALEWTVSGMDFPGALHLASRGESAKFVSFDERLVKRAKGLGVNGVALLRR
jgi:hypothetical protein